MRLPEVRRTSLIIVLAAMTMASASGQDSAPSDTIGTETIMISDTESKGIFTGRPGKAALYSLMLPGTGQIYNKKYWKLPIVYGAVGGTVGLLIHNTKQHTQLQEAYRLSIENGDPRADNLRRLRNEARKNQQTSIIILGVVWVLNAADAYVDAHLSTFDVDDDLSWHQVEPFIYGGTDQTLEVGIAISF